jgi:hypothetical protein
VRFPGKAKFPSARKPQDLLRRPTTQRLTSQRDRFLGNPLKRNRKLTQMPRLLSEHVNWLTR